MSTTINRRTLAKGMLWSAPAVVATASIPAYAASTCSIEGKAAIDAAFEEVRLNSLTAYLSQGSAGNLNGASQLVWLNLVNNTKFDIALYGSQALVIDFDTVRKSNSTAPNTEWTLTSWGTVTKPTTGKTVDGKQAKSWRWSASNVTLNGNFKGKDNVADMDWSTGMNFNGDGSITQMTLVSSPVLVPSFESITSNSSTVDSAGCYSYYQQKLSQALPAVLRLAGPLLSGDAAYWNNDGNNNVLPGGSTIWNIGTSFWSDKIGNYSSATYPPTARSTYSFDGIF